MTFLAFIALNIAAIGAALLALGFAMRSGEFLEKTGMPSAYALWAISLTLAAVIFANIAGAQL